MSEERFDRIDERLDRLEVGQQELTTQVTGLRTDVTGLKADVSTLNNRVDTLDLRMRLLHEDSIRRFAAFSEEPLATKRQMDQGFAELKELILHRIEPLAVAVIGLLQERRPRQP